MKLKWRDRKNNFHFSGTNTYLFLLISKPELQARNLSVRSQKNWRVKWE